MRAKLNKYERTRERVTIGGGRKEMRRFVINQSVFVNGVYWESHILTVPYICWDDAYEYHMSWLLGNVLHKETHKNLPSSIQR